MRARKRMLNIQIPWACDTGDVITEITWNLYCFHGYNWHHMNSYTAIQLHKHFQTKCHLATVTRDTVCHGCIHSWRDIIMWCIVISRPPVRLSVCLWHLFHYVPIIVSSRNFQEFLPMTEVMSMQKVEVRGQRSRSQRSRPNSAVSIP